MSRAMILATRGSALALAQANMIKAACEAAQPGVLFELRIIKTTGDKLQTAAMSRPGEESTKGLFTKELEVALLNGEADLAVHSLKDLPTELPEGLVVGATPERQDVRDVLMVRAGEAGLGTAGLGWLARNAVLATSSTRRAAQARAIRPDVKIVAIRGNVGTRIKKLLEQPELGGTILASAGLNRLGIRIGEDGALEGREVPPGIRACLLPLDEMLPCVGQAAIGIEIRRGDRGVEALCERLNDGATLACVRAERSFLRAMGGGCLSPVAAHATIEGDELRIRAVALKGERLARGEARGPVGRAEELGAELAAGL